MQKPISNEKYLIYLKTFQTAEIYVKLPINRYLEAKMKLIFKSTEMRVHFMKVGLILNIFTFLNKSQMVVSLPIK